MFSSSKTKPHPIRRFLPAIETFILVCVLAGSGQLVHAYVFSEDDRQRGFSASTNADRQSSSAIGGIVCDDGTVYSGFIIDVSSYAPGFEQPVLLTTAHTFVDSRGRSRGVCRYLSGGRFDDQWVISRVKLGIGEGVKRKPADSGDWGPRNREYT